MKEALTFQLDLHLPSSLQNCMFFNNLTSYECNNHINNTSIELHIMQLESIQTLVIYNKTWLGLKVILYHNRNLLDIHSKSWYIHILVLFA